MLKPGSVACFTVWGDKDNSLLFTVFNKVMVKYMTEEQKAKMQAMKTSFDFYYNREQSIQWLQDAGFTGIKMWR